MQARQAEGLRYSVTGGSPSSARAPSSSRSVPAAADAAVHPSVGLPLASDSIRALIACDARPHACTSRPCVRFVRLVNRIPLTAFAIDDSSVGRYLQVHARLGASRVDGDEQRSQLLEAIDDADQLLERSVRLARRGRHRLRRHLRLGRLTPSCALRAPNGV